MDEHMEENPQETTEGQFLPEEAEHTDVTKEKTFSLGKEIFEWVYTIAIALIIAFVVKSFVFDVVRVDGESMYPTLMNSDRLIVTKLGYKPEQGDVIILDSSYVKREKYISQLEKQKGHEMTLTESLKFKLNTPKELKTKYYVKRVIALPGQTVDIHDGGVYVDGQLLDEPYYDGVTNKTDTSVKYPITVKEDCVFVMGDNRANSTDSRTSILGQVPYKAIFGKAQVRFWPLNTIGLVK